MPFTVTGRNSEEAIERAIKEYDVPERASASA
jgi:predicted RNA-binding protein Jag